MKILVINAGSSSLKYQLFDMAAKEVIAKGNCERIGVDGKVTHKRPGKETHVEQVTLNNHEDAIAVVIRLLTDKTLGVLKSIDEIAAVGHRIVHGGEALQKSVILDDAVLKELESLVSINPLHGPAAIKGIEACRRLMPSAPSVGVFDTSFYSTIEPKAYIYPIPYEYYEKYKIRRYGFHGTSHRYVSAEAARFCGKPLDGLKMITCHLGNGSSITAELGGRAVDTSMGFTPQEGLPMGTRSGSIDPTIIPYLMREEGMTPDQADNMLNRNSGLIGISGVSSDCREVMIAEDEGNARAKLALDVLMHSIKKIIGSYVAELNGLDVLVFTAGIGENDPEIRRRICKDLDYLGIEIDEEKNRNTPRGTFNDITAAGARVQTLVIPTDEEYMIALDTMQLVSAQ